MWLYYLYLLVFSPLGGKEYSNEVNQVVRNEKQVAGFLVLRAR